MGRVTSVGNNSSMSLSPTLDKNNKVFTPINLISQDFGLKMM